MYNLRAVIHSMAFVRAGERAGGRASRRRRRRQRRAAGLRCIAASLALRGAPAPLRPGGAKHAHTNASTATSHTAAPPVKRSLLPTLPTCTRSTRWNGRTSTASLARSGAPDRTSARTTNP